MSSHDSQQQAAEGNHNHGDDSRRDLTEELFQIDQSETCQHGGDNLSLVADHIHLNKAEVPLGNNGASIHSICIQQLGRYERKPEHDTENLRRTHFPGN